MAEPFEIKTLRDETGDIVSVLMWSAESPTWPEGRWIPLPEILFKDTPDEWDTTKFVRTIIENQYEIFEEPALDWREPTNWLGRQWPPLKTERYTFVNPKKGEPGHDPSKAEITPYTKEEIVVDDDAYRRAYESEDGVRKQTAVEEGNLTEEQAEALTAAGIFQSTLEETFTDSNAVAAKLATINNALEATGSEVRWGQYVVGVDDAGDVIFGIQPEKPEVSTKIFYDSIPDAQAHLDTLAQETQDTLEIKYNPQIDKYEIKDKEAVNIAEGATTLDGSLESAQGQIKSLAEGGIDHVLDFTYETVDGKKVGMWGTKLNDNPLNFATQDKANAVLGDGANNYTFTKDETTGRVTAVLKAGKTWATDSEVHDYALLQGLGLDEYEVIQDTDAPDGAQWSMRRLTSGVTYNTPDQAIADLQPGFRINTKVLSSGRQVWFQERIPEKDKEPEEKIRDFDSLIVKTFQEQGAEAAYRIDSVRDRIERNSMTFMDAATIAGGIAKNANQFKEIMNILMTPSEPDAFNTAVQTAGNAIINAPAGQSAEKSITDALEGIQPGGSRQTVALSQMSTETGADPTKGADLLTFETDEEGEFKLDAEGNPIVESRTSAATFPGTTEQFAGFDDPMWQEIIENMPQNLIDIENKRRLAAFEEPMTEAEALQFGKDGTDRWIAAKTANEGMDVLSPDEQFISDLKTSPVDLRRDDGTETFQTGVDENDKIFTEASFSGLTDAQFQQQTDQARAGFLEAKEAGTNFVWVPEQTDDEGNTIPGYRKELTEKDYLPTRHRSKISAGGVSRETAQSQIQSFDSPAPRTKKVGTAGTAVKNGKGSGIDIDAFAAAAYPGDKKKTFATTSYK